MDKHIGLLGPFDEITLFSQIKATYGEF